MTKPFETQITCDDERVKKKNPSPTKPSNLFSTLLLPLASRQCQLCPRHRGSHFSERVAESVACEGEVRHVPEGGGGKFGQDTKVGTTYVAHKVDTTKSGYLTINRGGMSKTNLRPKRGQVSKYIRAPRGYTSSNTSKNPTGSSDIPTQEESGRKLTRTPRLG